MIRNNDEMGSMRPPKCIALVVDDEPLLRLSLGLELEQAGFDVVTAKDAAEAITQLEKVQNIDVLITDIEMPGQMNGIGLAHNVRARWPNIAILVNSGCVLPSKSALPNGVRFVAKPIDTSTLQAVLNELTDCLPKN